MLYTNIDSLKFEGQKEAEKEAIKNGDYTKAKMLHEIDREGSYGSYKEKQKNAGGFSMVTIISIILTIIIIKKWLKYCEKHDIHPTEEEAKKNQAYLLLWGDD